MLNDLFVALFILYEKFQFLLFTIHFATHSHLRGFKQTFINLTKISIESVLNVDII